MIQQSFSSFAAAYDSMRKRLRLLSRSTRAVAVHARAPCSLFNGEHATEEWVQRPRRLHVNERR